MPGAQKEEGLLPPQNTEAEKAVLGSLLIDPDAIVKVAAILDARDFYVNTNGWIYQAIVDLHLRNAPIDLISVSAELERRNRLKEVGGQAYLASLYNFVPTSLHVEHYAHIVENKAILRRLITAAGKIVQMAYESDDDAEDIVDRAEQLVFNVSEHRLLRDLVPMHRLVEKYYERLDYLCRNPGEALGIPTGFPQLDKVLGGLQRSDLIIIAGRPGTGKTSLALSIAHNAAREFGQRVAIFSLEMSSEQLVQRMVSMETGIDSLSLRLGKVDEDEWPVFVETAGALSELSLFIDETPAISPMEMRAKARRMYAEYGLDLVIVDYLQLMRADSDLQNRVQEISYISGALKALARELRVPVIALSQLSRAVEQRIDKRPRLADLRESGAIEQDADVVMFLYPKGEDGKKPELQNVVDVIVAKHRHGPTKTIPLYFKKESVTFYEVQLDEYPLE